MLERILVSTRRRIESAMSLVPPADLVDLIRQSPLPRDFAASFIGDGLHVIAEVKLASPSAGPIGRGLDPVAVASGYASNGAAAISVLTEPEFFDGDIEHLRRIRAAVDRPLLMKDFILDEYQLLQARAAGADCVLLIARLLGGDTLSEMLGLSAVLGLAALVEVHNEQELRLALEARAPIVGVNNRDLDTLKVDLAVARRLAAPAHDAGITLICESGIRSREDMVELAALGYRGFLVGTQLVRGGEPGRALAELLGGGGAV